MKFVKIPWGGLRPLQKSRISDPLDFYSIILGIFLMSISLFSLETLLPRIFAIYVAGKQTFFCVSIAMLGLSAGGLLVYSRDEFFRNQFHFALSVTAVCFAFIILIGTMLTTYLGGFTNSVLDQRYAAIMADPAIASNQALTMASIEPTRWFILLAGFIYGICFLPCGICIALVFKIYHKSIEKLYAFNLFGAGFGGVITVIGLTFFSISKVILFLIFLCSVASFAFLIPILPSKKPFFYVLIIVIIGVLCFLIYGNGQYEFFKFSVHKYAYGRSLKETPLSEITHQWSPLGRIGLFMREWSPPTSLISRMRTKVFVGMDLGGHSIVETFSDDNLQKIKYSSKMSDEILEPIIIPGLYRNLKDYLVLMAGNGLDMLHAYAWYGDAINIEGVEVSPLVYRLGLDYDPANLKAFFQKPNVTMTISEGRHFIETTQKIFDLILLSYSGATFASGTGSLALTPQFLFTKEAFVSYLKKLRPNGILIYSGATYYNMEGTYKIFAAALKELNPNADPRRHIITYRKKDMRLWEFAVFHKSSLTNNDINLITRAMEKYGLELICSPVTDCTQSRLRAMMLPRVNQKSRNTSFATNYSDNHPFFFFATKTTKGRIAIVTLVITLFISTVFAVLFLFVPMIIRNKTKENMIMPPWKYYVIFSLLGIGYMNIEVGAVERLELFLGYPTLTLVVILFLLLLGTGIGSIFSKKIIQDIGIPSNRICFIISFLVCLLLLFLNKWMYAFLAAALATRIIILGMFLIPLGLFLGTLFPHFIGELSTKHLRFIPWAWGINGAFSVVSSNLACLIYLICGSNAVIILGLLIYILLGLIELGWIRG